MQWLPEVGQWATYSNPLTGEICIGLVENRTRSRTDGKITIGVDGYRIPLEQCTPPSFDMATIAYESLLERCALVGELVDKLQPTN